MTTAQDIITRAFRESNTREVGFTPSSEELSEGLDRLQTLVDIMFSMVVGTKAQQWYLPRPQMNTQVAYNYPAEPGDAGIVPPNTDTTPPANVRIMSKITANTTLYFQAMPDDGALMEYVDVGQKADLTLNANGALFGMTAFDETLVIAKKYPDSRNAPRRWVYRGDIGSWVEITTLALTTDMPFPRSFDEYFITALSLRLTTAYGRDPKNITIQVWREMARFVTLQYAQSVPGLGGEVGYNTAQNYEWSLPGSSEFAAGVV